MEPGTLVNRTYKTALTVALLLFFVTLTAMIILAIITAEREDEREEAFDATLTAVVGAAQQTLAAHTTPPTPAPEVLPGQYPFAPDSAAPRYSAADTPAAQVVRGQVLDEAGQPVDLVQVAVWGDYTALQMLDTGEVAGLERGRWSLALDGQLNRRVWVQLVTGGRYLSAPVEIVFEASSAGRSAAEIIFRQVQPLT